MTSETVERQSFWAVTLEEARELHLDGILDATAYLLAIVKAHGAAGWEWAIDVKVFCEQWGFTERTFYRAKSILERKKLIFLKKRSRNIIGWRSQQSSDSTKAQNPDSSKAPPTVAASMPQVTLPLPIMAMALPQLTLPLTITPINLPLITVQLPIMAESQPETLDVQGIEESTKSFSALDQINFKSPTTTSSNEKEKVVVVGKNSFCEEKDKDWLTGIKARLREIRIAPDNVKWTFSQFPKNVIEDAIAYTAEQKWAYKPGAVYVKACREQQKPEQKSFCEDQFSAPPEPDEDTLNWLKELKDKRTIKDFYLCPWNNSRYRALFVDTGASMQPWWKVVETLKKDELTKT
ncbi:hypothetical protein Cri9333_0513 [Crinalium epipsammum PCC 9333]|uniref:Helix-turn-helix domain-containing protein n=1 Tax=Crinalium epipsammum PCC 9333 TaxID=1173022 RepID=K9VU33_9CYAN|nr:hypothetical protein [Crinalium epipsammum]AFZ11471.1 hypothetical protein Cri9333_0513 [Crinalium epipsammum PCC 9333]